MKETFLRLWDSLSAQRLRRSYAKHSDAGEAASVIVAASADVIMRIGVNLRAVYVSPSSLPVLGWRPDEMVGRGPTDFVHPDDLTAVVRDGQLHLAGTNPSNAIIHRMVRKDGGVIWVESRNRAIFDPKTHLRTDFVLVMRDITEQKILEDRLHGLALSDGLTGLANRRAFDETLERSWQQTVRCEAHMSLLLLDLDCFKNFNDHYGHQVGDDCLRVVGTALVSAISRVTDLAARYGGEEFAVILPSTDSAGAVAVARQIQSNIRQLAIPHAKNVNGSSFVTVSIGAATALCRPGGTMEMPQSLLASADAALYKAKQNGRNQTATSLLLIPIDHE